MTRKRIGCLGVNSEDAERRDQNKGLRKENSEMYGNSPIILTNMVFSRA